MRSRWAIGATESFPGSRSCVIPAMAMVRLLQHRGPDDAGVWVDPPPVWLWPISVWRLWISPRLAISPWPVPVGVIRSLSTVRSTTTTICAGNIRCCPAKAAWRGHSDTETFLLAIEAWGLEGALQRCAGMFALALWDRQERRLHLARDRFGEKPLYWGWLDQAGQRVLVFASELAALRACPRASTPPLNPEALAAFFRAGCIPAPLSIYAGVHQLPPGHCMEFSSPHQQPALRPWWNLQQQASQAFAQQSLGAAPSEADVLDQLEQTLQRVIAEQALADVPLGTFLSGGVDSSLITALLQAGSNKPVRSFTIAFPDEGGGEAGFNEAPYAAAVAAHLGTDHTEVALTAVDARALIQQLPQLYSEPFADSSQLPTHLVCREARRSGLTVALSGDGGDELFGGYNRHRLAPQLQRRFGAMPSLLRRGIARSLEQLPVSRRGLARDKRRKLAAALRASGSLAQLHHALTSLGLNPSALLAPELQQAASTQGSGPLSLPQAPSAAEQLMLADAMAYLPNDILVKVDRAAMAASLETRAPFLDHRVAAMAWQLPLALKLRDGAGKWALRQLLYRHVPRALIERPKAGFAMPIGPWLRGPLRAWADDLLDSALMRSQGWLQPEPVQRLWREHLAGADHTPQLWSVLMWQAWSARWLP